ncbi:uncharacterized protein DC041_0007730 [Schistosoma bovis]|uniref:TGF-beta family profile domain-containing protein n=1 Tax=Schistosoma bovis TaxID=6184 RepID=A0A430QMU7_SCHBO|nr:uncharacterized protein DC041_0007730 [Schistosoma bovis]
MENDQKFQSSNLFNDPYRLSINDFQRMFKLIKPEIAKTMIPQNNLTSMITLNITNRMIHWLKYNHIKIQAYKPLLRYLMIMISEIKNFRVVMEIKYRPRLKRQRRSLTKGDETIYNVCRSNGHHYSCCTQPLSVKFSDIGWDNWIIHPKSFEPNYCRGSCKVTSTKSLHYDVMDLLLRKNLSQFGNIQRDDVQSCCHPTQLTSMSVLYLDSNRELQMHTLHNLIVVMEIKYRPRLKRQRRSLTKGDETIYNVCRSNGHHYSCCTQPLSVKFSDIGWDNWIIHPKSFEPNYCRGSCKVTSTKSLHYDVMDLLLRKNLSQFGNIQRDDVQSCCHPTQLTSMSVLYLDSNRELQMHTLHNLIVLGCACS